MKRYTKLLPFFIFATLCGGTIEDKLGAFESESGGGEAQWSGFLSEVNQGLADLRLELGELYGQVALLDREGGSDAAFAELLSEVKEVKERIADKEAAFRERTVSEAKDEEEGYGLWDQEETTISQLVMEYGAGDYLYLVPPDIAAIKLNLHSSVPIPRESWKDLLKVLLSQNGIGIKEVNPYTRQLYQYKQDLMAVSSIVSSLQQLERLPNTSRVIYIFSPEIEHLKSTFHFFERFRDAKMTFIYTVGNKIAIASVKDEVKKLLTLYNTVWEESNQKVTKVVGLSRINAKEMQKILKSFFGALSDGNRFTMAKGGNELSVHPLEGENGIVLVGTKDVVKRAEQVIDETQKQLDDPLEMTVYWYSCRYSDPLDLAEVLEKVYDSLVRANLDGEKGKKSAPAHHPSGPYTGEYGPTPQEPGAAYPFESFQNNPVQPPIALPGTIEEQTKKSTTTHFIPYPKTGALMMVVRKDTLEKIKELIKKLDVPKKMVQIEVLLVEKKLNRQTHTGLNLLKLGSAATSTHQTGIDYDASSGASIKGLFKFFISRKKPSKGVPAVDVAYNFLLAQEDVTINASPTVMTVNQTPATISVVEEISINNGAAPIDNNANITFEKSYTREQFGITIVMTPTIHEADLDDVDGKHSVTLETNVTFDTPKTDVDDRPNVNRRHIENQVRVLDGQTIVLGGLRRKTSDDKMEKIPFLGEIPGIAKLFGTSKMTDLSSEMFIFITPHIIVDPAHKIEELQREELMRRPGEIPEFIERIQKAKARKKWDLFSQSFSLIFGNLNGN